MVGVLDDSCRILPLMSELGSYFCELIMLAVVGDLYHGKPASLSFSRLTLESSSQCQVMPLSIDPYLLPKFAGSLFAICLKYLLVILLVSEDAGLRLSTTRHLEYHRNQLGETVDRLQSLFGVGWFFEWPGGHRPLNSTWPWADVKPSLLVLWGVCWMFMTPNSRSISQPPRPAPHHRHHQSTPIPSSFTPNRPYLGHTHGKLSIHYHHKPQVFVLFSFLTVGSTFIIFKKYVRNVSNSPRHLP